MDTYVMEIDPPKFKLKQRALVALVGAALYFIIMLSWTYFWPTEDEKRGGLSGILLKALVMSLIWGIAMSFFDPRYKRPNYTLVVEDETITGVWEYPQLKWLATRKAVHKGKIRTIREFKGKFGLPDGLLLSEHTELGARMRGRVFLPNTLPDYEYLKRLAESWRFQEVSEL